ncbi:hypothetical protein FRC01_002476 [Tulasnella sp. 417]|nr:hypothetical protein FRC01_002476 [Tulasnella sp. 417]
MTTESPSPLRSNEPFEASISQNDPVPGAAENKRGPQGQDPSPRLQKRSRTDVFIHVDPSEGQAKLQVKDNLADLAANILKFLEAAMNHGFIQTTEPLKALNLTLQNCMTVPEPPLAAILELIAQVMLLHGLDLSAKRADAKVLAVTLPVVKFGKALLDDLQSECFRRLGMGHVQSIDSLSTADPVKPLVADPTAIPDSQHRKATLDFLRRSADFYSTEAQRYAATVASLAKCIGRPEGPPPGYAWEVDGVMFEASTGIGFPVVLMEMQNELGSSGCDPMAQCAFSYRKFWLEEHMRDYRNACCCPCFLLCISGPWVSVYGGILTDEFIVQCLSLPRAYGQGPDTEADHLAIAKVFAALKRGAQTLKEYYQKLEPKKEANLPDFSPTFQKFGETEKFTLRYTSGNLLVGRSGRAMFDAMVKKANESTEYPVKVRFTRKYSEEAHRLLAKANLAPKILHCQELTNGWTVVVMDSIQGKDLASLGNGPIGKRVLSDIESALTLLHEEGFVFGDLRGPNVMLCDRPASQEKTEQGAMLVDFDCAGMQGSQFYPYDLNPKVCWAHGVQGGDLITQEHDKEMFELLKQEHNM